VKRSGPTGAARARAEQLTAHLDAWRGSNDRSLDTGQGTDGRLVARDLCRSPAFEAEGPTKPGSVQLRLAGSPKSGWPRAPAKSVPAAVDKIYEAPAAARMARSPREPHHRHRQKAWGRPDIASAPPTKPVRGPGTLPQTSTINATRWPSRSVIHQAYGHPQPMSLVCFEWHREMFQAIPLTDQRLRRPNHVNHSPQDG
jgi:hypothetical protein